MEVRRPIPEALKKKRSLTLLFVVVVALGLALSLRFHFRIDLSADRTNSLSSASLKLYDEIPENLRIRYYLSPLLSRREPDPGLIQDFLRSLAAASRGKISVEVIDPAARPGEAEKAGLKSGLVKTVERSESRSAVVYSGIVVDYLDRTQVIPFVTDSANIEYLMLKSIRAVVSGREPLLSILVGDAEKSLDNDYSLLAQKLEAAQWSLARLSPGDAVPGGTSTLLVLGNNDLGAHAVAPIRDYLARGGRAFFAVKGVHITAAAEVTASPVKETALLDLLASYGVKVGRDLVLDRSALTVPFQKTAPDGAEKLEYYRYPHWIIVRPENIDSAGGLFSASTGLDLFWPSSLESLPVPGMTLRPLIKTGINAWLQTKDFVVTPGEESTFTAEADATRGRYTVAAELSGTPPLSGPVRMMIVSSSDFASDLVTMTDSSFNIDFVLRSIEWLDSGGDPARALPKAARDRRFSKPADEETTRSLVTFNYLLNLALIPALVLAFGAIRLRRRKKSVRHAN